MKHGRRIVSLAFVFAFVVAVGAVCLVACDKKQEEAPHAHQFGEWTTTLEPTCTVDGSKERVCACGEKEVEAISALGHVEVVDAAVAPTCSQKGKTEGRHCSRCGEVVVASQELEMLEHTIVTDAAVEPTCTATGLTEGFHCSVCGRIIVAQHIINALGHDFDEHYHCSICDEDREGFNFELVMKVGEHMVNEQNTCIFCGTPNVIEDFVFDESVATYSFRYTGPRTKLTLPAKFKGVAVTTIGRSAFREAGAYLTSIDITDNITMISSLAFSGCSALKSVTIGNHVAEIGEQAFMGCASIESITVLDGHPKYHSAGNCLIETETKTLIAGCKTSVIPVDGSVTKIGNSAFMQNGGLESISIPEGVTEIGNSAFYLCNNLRSIILPHSLKKIGQQAFFYDWQLTNIYYDGTMAEWKEIEKGSVWDMYTGEYTIHCSDGNIAKSDTENSGSKA